MNSKKKCFVFIGIFFFSLSLFAQPTISSFAPASGPVGTTVTITGTNFSVTPANNIVFFGAVRANVSAATATSLTVTVPAGTTYQPITVTVNNLTAYSNEPFIVTFTGATITPGTFEYVNHVDSVNGIETNDLAEADLDGDGKIDITVVDRLGNTMSVYRNITTAGGDISFASKIDFATGSGPQNLAIGDLDGDGKPDIVVANRNDNSISVFKNLSTPGNISFGTRVDFPAPTQPAGIAIRDIDGDGKPDVAVANINLSTAISIFRNTTTGGAVSFAPRMDLSLPGGSDYLSFSDLDGDGKADMVITSTTLSMFFVFKNTSIIGTISFANPASVNTEQYPDRFTFVDIDQDSKPDIVVPNYYAGRISVFRNTSTISVISFLQTEFYAGSSLNFDYFPDPVDVNISDVDGDGKPDAVVLNRYKTFSILQNTSSPGNVSLANGVDISSSLTSAPVLLSDLDGDGKPDLTAIGGLYRVVIWKNKITAPYISSFSPTSADSGTTITITGNNFSGATAVSFGGIPATSFAVISPTTITAVVGAGSSGEVAVTTPYGTAKLDGFILAHPPVISSFSPTSGATDSIITINGLNFTGTTAVSFGGIPAYGFNVVSSTTIIAKVDQGASGNISVTTPLGTATLAGFTYIPSPKITSFTPASAGTGTMVTITGINFTGATSVTLGGVPVSIFTIASSTTITAMVGNGASGNVSVTNAYGTSSVPGFTYIPPPSITSFSPDTAIVGTTITITGTNFTNATSVTFGGTPAYSFQVISPTTITATVWDGAPGIITVTTPGGIATISGFIFIYKPIITDYSPQMTGTGAVVTITGDNFSTATSVTFGGVPAASFIIVSPTTIKAVVGNGADGIISITTIAGTASTNGGFVFTTLPIIHSVSPLSGPIGTTVTISGANFQASATNEIVYFGGVKANIISTSANTITASVPAGATYKPVSVTIPAKGLTAYSDARFDVTFPVDTSAFNDNSFAGKMDLATGQQPYDVKQGDFDGDGKLDIVVINHSSSFISIYRNASSPGKLTFSDRIDIEIGFQAKSIAVGDMDGDGKLDLIIANDQGDNNNLNIFIFRNLSTPGNISFVNSYTIGGFLFYAGFMEIADLDRDGHPDIVFICTECGVAHGGIFVSQNLSTNGNLSFSIPALYQVNNDFAVGLTSGLTVSDFNRDGKPDVLVGLYMASGLFYFESVSGPGGINFSPISSIGEVNYPTSYYSLIPFTGNFSSPDISDFVSGRFIYKNNSGNFSEMLETSVNASFVYDLNGDGKQDILGSDLSTGELSLIKNVSDANAIAFASAYNTKNPEGTVLAGDFDGDSKPEICILYRSSNILRILRNRMNESLPPPPSITSFNPDSAGNSDQVIITGNNLDQVSSVTFGGTPASYFTIVSKDTIIATVGDGASGEVVVTNPAGKDSLNGFVYLTDVAPVINSFSPTSSSYLDDVAIYGKHFDGATAVSFGNIPASSFTIQSSNIITARPGPGASGDVTVTTPHGTASKQGFIFYYAPGIDSVSPLNGITGTMVIIHGSNFSNVISVSFGGIAASSFTVVDSTMITAVVGAGAPGDINVTTLGGTATFHGFTFGVVTGIGNLNANSRLLKVYPNPAQDYLVIEYPISNKTASIQWIDISGRIIKTTSIPGNMTKTEINTKNLSPGVYEIVWSDGKNLLTKTVMILK